MLNDLREELEERDERFSQLSAQANTDQEEDSADLFTRFTPTAKPVCANRCWAMGLTP